MSNVIKNTRVYPILKFFFVLAIVVGFRYITVPDLIRPGNVMVVPDDPPYQLRRVQIILSSPQMLYTGDPFVDYPHRARVYWNFGFDGLLAGATAIFYGFHPTIQQAALVTSLLIPLLAGLVMLVMFFVFRRFAGDEWALLAMLLMGLFYPFFEYSFAGRVDHHVMEPLFPVLAFLVVRRRPFLAGVIAGISHGFALAAFIPAYTLVGLLSLMWVYDEARDALRAADLLAGTAIGAGLALLMSPNPLTFVFYSSSLFHCLFPVVAAVASYIFYRIARAGPPMKQGVAIGRYIALIFVGLGALSGLLPAISRSLGAAFNLGAGTTMNIALESLSYFKPLRFRHILSFLMILSSLYGAFYAFAKDKSVHLRVISLMGLIGWLAAGFQRRWLIGFSPFVVMSAVVGLYAFFRIQSGFKNMGKAVAATVAVILIVSYAYSDSRVRPISYSGRLAYAIAGFIHDNTPAVDPKNPSYSILAPWYMGHVIQAYGDRPTVCDNFFGVPENDRAMRQCDELFFSTDIKEAIKQLTGLRVRYLVITPPNPKQVRAQMAKEGRAHQGFVTKDGRFTMKFAHTLIVRLGVMHGRAMQLPDGTKLAALPRFRFIRDFRIKDPSGKVRAEASLFEFMAKKTP